MPTVEELPKKVSFKDLDKEIAKFWEEKDIYNKIKKQKEKNPEFLFIDGPPYTTGAIHLGTAWNKVLKDFVLRYKRMRGFNVRDTPGFDMHGLPIEVKVEQEIGISNKKEIEKIGIAKFTSRCKEFALSNLKNMIDQFKALAVAMNWDRPYMTLTNEYIEGIWWAIKKAYERGLLYKGLRPLNTCPRCQTAVAKHEYEYKKVRDYSIFVKFPVVGKENEYIIIWTTTPWTLPANLAVMVNPFFKYVRVKVDNEVWIMAKGLTTIFIQAVLGKDFEILEEFDGEKLLGLPYIHPLLDEVPKQKELNQKYENAHKIILSDEYVTLEQGTGCVHTAPGHGPEDFIVGQKYGLPPFSPVDEAGKMTEEAGKYAGLPVKEASEKVLEDLKRKGLIVYIGEVEHDYAHCWRCKSPLVYRAVEQWFLKVSEVAEQMREENRKVYWVPKWAGNPWFDNWLKGIQDWCISRQRYWGTPLPVWICNKCGKIEVIGSIEELEAKSNMKLEDLHRPWVDKVMWPCECGGTMKRVEDVLDVWVDSGCAVWASIPAMLGKKNFDEWKQADLVLEGKDQIRGWFNTMMSMGTVSSGKCPYKAVYMHGFVNDAEGRPMSKSLGNIILPEEVIQKYGIDSFRFYILTAADPGEDMKFGWKEMDDTFRFMNILWNTYVFATTFMKSAEFNPQEHDISKLPLRLEDKWLLSKINSVIKEVTSRMEKYDLPHVPKIIQNFVMLDLSRWYIKIIRDRTWVTATGKEKDAALATLYYTLLRLLYLIAPITPIIAEKIYQFFVLPVDKNAPESVHMNNWPDTDSHFINTELEEKMDLIRDIVEAASSIRQDEGIKLRWVCKALIIKPIGEVDFSEDMLNIIKDMSNVKKVEVKSKVDEADNLKGKELKHCIVYLDLSADEEIMAERFVRELIRNIQFTRKKNAYHVGEEIDLKIVINDTTLKKYAEQYSKQIKGKVSARKIEILSTSPELSDDYVKGEIKYQGNRIEIYFKRV
ncbi:MAG: isoleucine--tRNA ligase [Candidatus Odinarchaeia archaeon]